MADPVDRLRAAIGREPFLAAELTLLAGLFVVLVGVGLPDPYGLAAIGLWLALPFTLAFVVVARVGVSIRRRVATDEWPTDSPVAALRAAWFGLESLAAVGFLAVGAMAIVVIDVADEYEGEAAATPFFAGAILWLMAAMIFVGMVGTRILATAVYRVLS